MNKIKCPKNSRYSSSGIKNNSKLCQQLMQSLKLMIYLSAKENLKEPSLMRTNKTITADRQTTSKKLPEQYKVWFQVLKVMNIKD